MLLADEPARSRSAIRRSRSSLALLVLLLVLYTPGSVSALTLAGLTAPGFTLSLGEVVVSDVEVLVTGDLSTDLDLYGVLPLDDAFRLTGGLVTTSGSTGTLGLSYTVSVDTGFEMDGASLIADGFVLDPGAYVIVTETFLTDTGPVSLAAYALEGQPGIPIDTADFMPALELDIVTTIQIGGGQLATAPFIDQRFHVIPEPTTTLMMLIGLIGLAWSSRGRERRARSADAE